MQTEENTKTCYRRGNRRTRWKTSPRPSKLKSIHKWISWSTWITKDPPSLVYPMYLSLLSFCYQQTSQSIVFTSFLNPAIHTIASAKPHQHLLENPKNFPSSKTLSILWKCVGYVWVQISSQGMTMGEGRRKGYIDFSLRLSSSLSLKVGVLCCRKPI